MFSLEIKGGERGQPWCLQGEAIRRGRDCIIPLRHEVLTTRAFLAGSRLFVGFLENPCGLESEGPEIDIISVAAIDSLRADIETWPLHWMWLDVGDEEVIIRASGWPTVPVFLSKSNDVALVEWDPTRLYPHVRVELDEESARRFLRSFDQPYLPQTIISDILLLPALHEARWRPGAGWAVERWRSSPGSYPRVLKQDADPVATVAQLLRDTVRRTSSVASGRIGCGLSGGLDSAVIGGTLHCEDLEFKTFGLVLPQEEGIEQAKRRRALTKSWCVIDHAVMAEDAPDWSATSTFVSRLFVPWEELNYELFDQLYASATAKGCTSFFTGFGGDELFGFYRGEDNDILDQKTSQATSCTHVSYPNYQASSSAMEAASSTAAQMLRHGLWPVHPLTSPEIVTYCAALPLEWRRNRRLFRILLDRREEDSRVTWENSPESFTPLFERSFARCPDLKKLLLANRLVHKGFVARGETATLLASLQSGHSDPNIMLRLIAIAVAELTLVSLEQARI